MVKLIKKFKTEITFVALMWATIEALFFLASPSMTKSSALALILTLSIIATGGLIAYAVNDTIKTNRRINRDTRRGKRHEAL